VWEVGEGGIATANNQWRWAGSGLVATHGQERTDTTAMPIMIADLTLYDMR